MHERFVEYGWVYVKNKVLNLPIEAESYMPKFSGQLEMESASSELELQLPGVDG